MALWQLDANGAATPVSEECLKAEALIESAVESAPALLGIEVLIVGRQVPTPSGPRGFTEAWVTSMSNSPAAGPGSVTSASSRPPPTWRSTAVRTPLSVEALTPGKTGRGGVND